MNNYIVLTILLFISLSKLNAAEQYKDYIAPASKTLTDIKNDINVLKGKKTKVMIRDIAQIEEKIAQVYKILQNAQDNASNTAQKTAAIKIIRDRLAPLENEIDNLRNQL